jgi:hypothetical protein
VRAPAGDDYRAVDAVRPPAGTQIAQWRYAKGVLTLELAPTDGGRVIELLYTWNESYFQR